MNVETEIEFLRADLCATRALLSALIAEIGGIGDAPNPVAHRVRERATRLCNRMTLSYLESIEGEDAATRAEMASEFASAQEGFVDGALADLQCLSQT